MDVIKPKQIAGKKVRKEQSQENPALQEVRKWGAEVEEKKAVLKDVKKWAKDCRTEEAEERRKRNEEELIAKEKKDIWMDRLGALILFGLFGGLLLIAVLAGGR